MPTALDITRTVWFRCVGCGGTIGFFPDGLPPHYPPGSCGHSKPMNKANIPNSVECALFNQLDPIALWELHCDLEPLPQPTGGEWLLD